MCKRTCKCDAKWHCPHCSLMSKRRWNIKDHIRRKHRGIGQPIDKQSKEFNDRINNQLFPHNLPPYFMNDISLGRRKQQQEQEEKEPDMIDKCYEMVMEYKEKFR